MTIYLDAVWLLNFMLDWMILLLTHWMTKSSSSRLRLILGALVASMLVPLTLYFPSTLLVTPLGKGIYSILIILSSFGFKNFRVFLKQILSFYFITFAIGGGLMGIYFFLGSQFENSSGTFITYNEGFGDGVSWLFVITCFPIVWFFTRQRMDKLVTQKIRYDQIIPVTMEIDQQAHETTGFIDSGNQLIDPITRYPVIICDQKFLSQWFSDEEWKELKHAEENLNFDALPEKWVDKIKIIPYQGVSGSRTFMIGFKPDQLTVLYENQEITLKRVLVGIQFGELATDGSYHCLLHPQLLKTIVTQPA